MIRRYVITVAFSMAGAVGVNYGASMAALQVIPSPQASEAFRGTGQTRTPLADGRWLLAGGQGAGGPVPTLSLFDPLTRTTIVLPPRLTEARAWHTATMLPDGSILIAGGRGSAGAPLASAERFDAATETFTQ